ncbi:DEAD/DEAH box helicase family protein [Pseudomonas sp. GD03696]|uniref:DEAD/DEAH box helicase n=1 Tax=Pseudomonas sp. GD03696 TaxID=2975368 RepID=UPI0024484820|nr:DEAD/DEAH box helicase family protein [Pseudomonas sp. GD03696]MDH1930482.1 DEAD/DEAH box helicase family protein [Pseudomonas sp. GD03696]
MTKLRTWQSLCIDTALNIYSRSPHFFCQATPGAGKSRMAAETAKRLLSQGAIDFVLCFGPSCQIVSGLAKTFAKILERPFDGRIGAIGAAITYQAMEYQSESFWRLLDDYRVFAVFDEIHHCSGNEYSAGNSWGQIVLQRIQDRASYTLALSGTPWRSDEQAIALARYSNSEGQLICDYRYGLEESIKDGVCRSPRIALMEVNSIRVETAIESNPSVSDYSSIAEMLSDSPVTFEDLISHEGVVEEILSLGREKLNRLIPEDPSAAGLVIASNILHAYQVASTFQNMGEECLVVTNRTPDAQSIIENFRRGSGRWIVAVGMISEGTDIPRLRVCCYLSRIRTELHYRQVLGRILRRKGVIDDHAWLYVLAEPSLLHFSHRIASDLPDDCAVVDLIPAIKIRANTHSQPELSHPTLENPISNSPTIYIEENVRNGLSIVPPTETTCPYQIDLSAGFRTEILSIY